MLDERGREEGASVIAHPRAGAAFVLVPPALLPARWRDRAVDYCAVWLDADELAELSDPGDELPEDLRVVVPLVVAGYTANAIADRLFVSPRTVHRRLRRLRRLVGARSHAELVSLLARNANIRRAAE